MRSLYHIVWLTWLACLPAAQAATKCGGYDNPCEKPLHLGKIETIVIERNWHGDEDNVMLKCNEKPPLTVDDVRKYMEKAGRIDALVRNENISVSSCRAYGTLTVRGGRQYGWSVGIWRDGVLSPSDEKDPTKFDDLYCGRCKAPFAQP